MAQKPTPGNRKQNTLKLTDRNVDGVAFL